MLCKVSVAAGIPDFRCVDGTRKVIVLWGVRHPISMNATFFLSTPGTGLYSNLKKYNLPYPEAVFDVGFFRSKPKPFVTLASELWPGLKHSPTMTHCFLKLLSNKGLLLRNYSQNIDGLEHLAGIPEEELVVSLWDDCLWDIILVFTVSSHINGSSPDRSAMAIFVPVSTSWSLRWRYFYCKKKISLPCSLLHRMQGTSWSRSSQEHYCEGRIRTKVQKLWGQRETRHCIFRWITGASCLLWWSILAMLRCLVGYLNTHCSILSLTAFTSSCAKM